MPNPIHVERRYAELIDILEGSYSYRYQWQEAGSFLDLIREEFSTYDTYCIQIVQQLPEFANPLSVAGINPKVFINWNNQLNELQEALPQVQDNENFWQIQASIQQSLLFLFACLGELEKGIQEIGYSDYSYSSELNLAGMDVDAQIQKSLEAFKTGKNQQLLELLAGVKQWWSEISNNKEKVIYVPVVEKTQSEIQNGRIRELSARVVGEEEKEDYYEDYYAVVGAEKGRGQRRNNIVSAVRDLLKKEFPEAADTYFHLQFSYNLKLGLQHGWSYELPSAISAFCTISQQLSNRKRFSPVPYIAATGEIGDSGDIEGIDEESIKAKTEVAFFSWITCLLVPKSQKELFEKQVDKLQDSYPSRELLIVGLSKFKNFLFDRRLVNRTIESKSKYLFKKAWAKRFSISGISTIIVLLAIIGAMWYGPVDRNPAIGVYKGEQLHIQNKYGQTLETIGLNSRTVSIAKQPQTSSKANVSFADITGDGRNEIFWITQFEDDSFSTIKAKELGADTLLWSYPVIYELNFPKKEKILPSSFQIGKIQIVDFEGDNHPELIASFNHSPFFPGILSIINAKNGTEKGHLVNPGHIYDFDIADIDEDSVPEVVFGGVSNSFESAFVAAVDHNKIKGMLPHNKNYELNDYDYSEISNYVTIPPTILGQSIKSRIKSNRTIKINIIPDKGLIEAEVNDTRFPIDTGLEEPYAYLKYFFDYDFKVTNIGTSDTYDATAQQFYEEGLINKMPDRSYFEAFKDSLLYWDGTEFLRGRDHYYK